MTSNATTTETLGLTAADLERAILVASNAIALPPPNAISSPLRSVLGTTTADTATRAVQVVNEWSLLLQGNPPPTAASLLALELFQSTSHIVVAFHVLTAVQHSSFLRCVALNDNDENDVAVAAAAASFRVSLRQVMMQRWMCTSSESQQTALPRYLRTKMAVVFALLVRVDFPQHWPSAFDEVLTLVGDENNSQSTEFCLMRHDTFVRILDAISDEILNVGSSLLGNMQEASNESSSHHRHTEEVMKRNGVIRDVLRGYTTSSLHQDNDTFEIRQPPPTTTLVAKLLSALRWLIDRHSIATQQQSPQETHKDDNGAVEIVTLALSVLRRWVSWIPLSLVVQEDVLRILYNSLWKRNSSEIHYPQHYHAVLSLDEIVGRGMEGAAKLQLVSHCQVLTTLTTWWDEQQIVGTAPLSPTHQNEVYVQQLLLPIASLVDSLGVELLDIWDAGGAVEGGESGDVLLSQCMTLFLKCMEYPHDRRVCGQVITLACRWMMSLSQELQQPSQSPSSRSFAIAPHVTTLWHVFYHQLKLSAHRELVLLHGANDDDDDDDDDNDDENHEELEEETQHAEELIKFYHRIVRIVPSQVSLDLLSRQLQSSLSSSASLPATSFDHVDSGAPAEWLASLRLVHRYCEGLLPPPGIKAALQHAVFVDLVIAVLSSSAPTQHPEIALIQHEIAVRFHTVVVSSSSTNNLLPHLLSSMLVTLANESSARPRSKFHGQCCQVLLRFVKALTTTAKTKSGSQKKGNRRHKTVGNDPSDDKITVQKGPAKVSFPLRSYVETTIGKIREIMVVPHAEQTKLGTTAKPKGPHRTQLRLDDKLVLCETLGLLVSRTGLEVNLQRDYLMAILAPIVKSVDAILVDASSSPLVDRARVESDDDGDEFSLGSQLSASLALMANLSKGLVIEGNHTSSSTAIAPEIGQVLGEVLLLGKRTLEALPQSGLVRRKFVVLLQQLMVCRLPPESVLAVLLGKAPVAATQSCALLILLEKCTSEKDIANVGQLFLQLCQTYRATSAPLMEVCLIPFLAKCEVLALAATGSSVATPATEPLPPHVLTEQLGIRKLGYVLLQHMIAVKELTAVLLRLKATTSLSAANEQQYHLDLLRRVFQFMFEGAIQSDALVQKTCIQFFRELIEQWCSTVNEIVGVEAASAMLLQYVYETLLPHLTEKFVSPRTPKVLRMDAMLARAWAEFALLYFTIQSLRGWDEWHQYYVQPTLLRRLLVVLPDAEARKGLLLQRLGSFQSSQDVQTHLLEIISV